MFALLFMVGTVSAANETSADVALHADDGEAVAEDVLEDSIREVKSEESAPVKTTIKSNDTNIIKDKEFTVQLTDSNSQPIANKSVSFTFKSKVTNSTTDDRGIAKLKISAEPGTYKVKYSFADSGYAPCENSTKILVLSTSTSKINAPSYTAYVGVKNKYTVTLKAGKTPLANREIVFKINGKTYTKKTDSKGRASINIDEAKGTYKLKYSYAGEDNIKSASGSVKIKVKKGVPTEFKKANSVIYRDKKTNYFKIKLLDVRGNPLKSKKVTFKFKGKKFTKKTNSKGIASVKINLKTGSYKIKVNFAKTSKYNKVSKTYKIKVKPVQARNNGFWLLSADMASVDFDYFEKIGTKHIFLNFKSIEKRGKSYVENWIKNAKSHKIKVHMWMQVFYTVAGGWENPVKNGKVDYKLISSKVKEAKSLAKVKGVAGIHFDYVRYPGNAHDYKNSVKAVNTFIKKATKSVHKVNKKLIVSAAVMPEPSAMKKYYAQDIPTMGKYLDAIIPMVYKGNYHAGTKWIKSVTKTFAKQSKKAKIWTGLQTYRSDEKLSKIPAKELMGDADAAALGGAYGVILFRYGLIDYINFNEV